MRMVLSCLAVCAIGLLLFPLGVLLDIPMLEQLAGWLTAPYTAVMALLALAVLVGALCSLLARAWPRRKRD